ncbi:MAG TPA: hypothetical protein PKN62_02535 [bacterium]|nr:hypothetical protein [bacterium]
MCIGDYHVYHSFEEFDRPLSRGKKNCQSNRSWQVFEGRGRMRQIATNFGGVLGCWHENNDVPCYNNSQANLEIIKEELLAMTWTNELILAAVCLLKNKGYQDLIGLIPNLTRSNEFRFYYGHILKALFISEQYSLETIGCLVGGRFNFVNQHGVIVISCYYNQSENVLSEKNDDQLEMLSFLKKNGGRFLATYIS